ncbi:hypothetical protein ACTFIW_000933 [Dictyostelium discoideum]
MTKTMYALYEEQEVNLPVGGRLFHHKHVWKELGLPNFCQEVVNGLKVHLLRNFKPMPNPIPFSIPEGPKSDCNTKEVQDLLLENILIVGSTKEECLSNLKKTMDLLVKLGFKLNMEKSVLEPTQSITFLGLQIDSVSMKLLVPKEKKKSVIKEIRNFLKLDCCSPRKLASSKGKLIALNDAVIPFRLYTRRTNKFHSQCLTLANGDWDQSFPIPQYVKSEISHWLTVLNQWNGKEICLFPSYDYVLTTDASESGTGTTLKKGNKTIKTWTFQWSTTQSNMSSNHFPTIILLSDNILLRVFVSIIVSFSLEMISKIPLIKIVVPTSIQWQPLSNSDFEISLNIPSEDLKEIFLTPQKKIIFNANNYESGTISYKKLR